MNREGQNRPERREIYLDNRSSYMITITPEGYQQILEIIRATAICEECRQLYSKGPEYINVAGLLCLQCFLKKHHTFTFMGPLDPALLGEQEKYYDPPKAEKPTYLFSDQQGHAHLTDYGPGKSADARESKIVTLKYWHFPRPEQGERNGQLVKISDYGWSIHGDVRIDNVIMLQHGSKWKCDELLFVAKRDGQAIQINRRKPMHRALLAEARAEIEATKTPGGMYLIDGKYQSYIYDSDVYQLVARRVGEAMTATGTEHPEPEPEQMEANPQE